MKNKLDQVESSLLSLFRKGKNIYCLAFMCPFVCLLLSATVSSERFS
jgi:hypothetical protein